MRGYLVHYVHHRKGGFNGLPGSPVRGTVVLQEVHPLAWAGFAPAAFSEHSYREILSWQEFDYAYSTEIAVIQSCMESDSLDDMLTAANVAASGDLSSSPAGRHRDLLSTYARELRRENKQ